MNQDQLSGISNRLQDLYDLADKYLSESKLKIIQDEIRELSFDYVVSKIKSLKQWVINGQKFDTATVFRFLNIKVVDKQEKPKSCDMCDDGYIMAIDKENVYAYACSCELGKFRHKSEKISYYKGQEKTENQKLRNGFIDFDIDIKKTEKIVNKKYGKEIQSYETKCPF